MPFDRLSNRIIFKNDDILYDETFNKKGVKFINQYDTAEMSYPSREDLVGLKYDTRIWKPATGFIRLLLRLMETLDTGG